VTRMQFRLTALVLALVSLLMVEPGGAQHQSNSGRVLALVGARIYSAPEAAPIDSGVLLIRDRLLVAVGPKREVPIPTRAQIIDCPGATIVAGFWNSHVHFTEPHWGGADTLPAAVLTRHLQTMLTRYGFVRVLDTGSWLENTRALRRRIDSGEVLGPAIQTTGSGFVPRDASPFYILPARLPELRSPDEARRQVASLLAKGADAIKLFTGSYATPTRIVPMSLGIVRAATAEAHRQGKQVVAHPSNNAGLEAALKGGVDVLAHTTPEGGPWEATVSRRMAEAHLALIPTLKLWTFELSRKGADSATVRRFLDVAIAQLQAYVRSGGEVLFGTDVGYMTDYDPTDEYVYMQRAGMSFRQVLATLTTTPAKRFSRGERTNGRLAPGMEADLVVLEGDPEQDIRALSRVRQVLRQGREIYAGELAGRH
jgi:imidazolonepropionase-like amidohydrolase